MTPSRRTWPAVGLLVTVALSPLQSMAQTSRTPLKNLTADQIVQRIAYCKGEYHLTMESGEQRRFPELNLRLKTDASAYGPERDKPVLLRAGMQGDRAQLIFSSPAELKGFVVERCEGGER